MVSPYNNPNAYIQAGMPIYNENETVTSTIQKQNSVPSGVAGAAVGAIGGGVVGYKKNPYMNKNYIVSDAFTKKVHENILEKLDNAEVKNTYKKVLKLIKDLDNVKTVEELKTLIKTTNPNIPTANLDYIKAENLTENIKTIKNSLNSSINTWYQETKNLILSAWNGESKKFVKPEHMSDDVFEIIKNSTKGLKTKVITKYAGITGLITGTAAILIHKILNHKATKKNNQQIQY